MTVSSKVSVLLAVGALLLVGCSDSSDDASTESSTTTTAASQQSTLADGVYTAFIHDVGEVDGPTNVTFDILDRKTGQAGIDGATSDGLIQDNEVTGDFAEQVENIFSIYTDPTTKQAFLDGFSYLVNPDPALITLPVASESKDLSFPYAIVGLSDSVRFVSDGPIVPNVSLSTVELVGKTIDPDKLPADVVLRAGTADLADLGAAARLSTSTTGKPVADGLVLQPLSEQSGTPFQVEVKDNEVIGIDLQTTWNFDERTIDFVVLYNEWLNEDNDAADEFMNAPLPYGQYSATVSAIDVETDGAATITMSLVDIKSIDTQADTRIALGKDRQIATTDSTTFEASTIGSEPKYFETAEDYAEVFNKGIEYDAESEPYRVTDFYVEIQAGKVAAISNIKYS
jgi:major membrane immunogen (membrane-anchored lipoprotein)